MAGGRVTGVADLARRDPGKEDPGLVCAGNSGRVAAMAGMRLPIESHVLEAFVSEENKSR